MTLMFKTADMYTKDETELVSEAHNTPHHITGHIYISHHYLSIQKAMYIGELLDS